MRLQPAPELSTIVAAARPLDVEEWKMGVDRALPVRKTSVRSPADDLPDELAAVPGSADDLPDRNIVLGERHDRGIGLLSP